MLFFEKFRKVNRLTLNFFNLVVVKNKQQIWYEMMLLNLTRRVWVFVFQFNFCLFHHEHEQDNKCIYE